MSKWETVKLKDLGDIVTGNTPKTSEEENYNSNDIPFIKPSDFDDENILMKSTEFYISETARSKARILPVGSIIMTCIGIIGKTMITNRECAFNQQINAIIPNKNVDSRFIAYSLLYKKDILQKHANAAVVPIINKTVFSNIEIFLPPLKVQCQIAENLDKVTHLVDLCNAILEKLDLLVKARFLEMFGEPILNPKGWEMVTIADIVTEVKYGTSKPAVEGGKYPYLRMNNLTYDGHLDLTDLKRIDIPDNEIEKCIVRKGDVLFNRTNSVELVGKTCVFDEVEEMVIAGYIIRIRLKQNMLPLVLSYFMNTDALKKKLRNMAKGAVNQANINAQELQAIEIYLPPLDLQAQFVNFAEECDKSKLAVKKVLEKAETLKKALMQKYFG